MANILLIATGGTRAPTQIDLAERFTKDGHSVRLIASTNALRFLGAHMARNPRRAGLYLRNYRPALRETLAYYAEKPKEVPHIAEGKWADVVVMAPATCNSVGKLAAGVSDNYPLLVLRAIPRTKRVIVVPSMNPEMWYDPLFQRNIDLLNATEKYRVLCPRRGQMLSGDFGIGAQVPLEEIVSETYRAIGLALPSPEDVLSGSRAGLVPWAEEGSREESAHVFLVDPDEGMREQIRAAMLREHPSLIIEGFSAAGAALEALRDRKPAAVITEIDFPSGMSGHDLVDALRRPGLEDVQVIAISRRGRQEVGAEALARKDVLFAPKPLNLAFLVGMVEGSLKSKPSSPIRARTLQPGEILFRQGDQSREVYVLRRGKLRVRREQDGRDVELGLIDEGEMVGELALVGGRPRAATVEAIEPSEVAVLDPESMGAFLARQPAWVRLLIDSLVGHLRETSDKLVQGTPSPE